MKKCKSCGMQIEDNAIKCIHCLEYQDIIYKWKGVLVKPSFFQKTFCTHCYYIGKPKTIIKGSLFLEIVLWFFMIIPGLAYTTYRQQSKYCVCSKCGSNQINKI